MNPRCCDHDSELAACVQAGTQPRLDVDESLRNPGARLLGNGYGLPDALLLLVALRNVRRAAELVIETESLTKLDARQILADALARFDATLPGVKAARDVVEHLDEYAIGVGLEQRKLKKVSPR